MKDKSIKPKPMITKIMGQDGKMTVIEKQGIAQNNGFVNRHAFRQAMIYNRRRTKNTSMEQIRSNVFNIGRITAIPFYFGKRKKLKYWQKKSA